MSRLSEIWDGTKHDLEPDVHFCSTGCTLVIDGYEELEEEEPRSPFELPSKAPVLKETRTRDYDPRFPNRPLEQAWGCLSVNLTAFAMLAEVNKEQYQENNHSTGEIRWTFMSKRELAERI